MTAIFISGILPAASPPAACAQAASGTILGVILDASGAVVPGATIISQHVETGLERTTVTAGNGEFVLPGLAIGAYRLSVSHPGFRTAVREGIQLDLDEKASVRIVLEVGPIDQVVRLEGDTPFTQAASSSVGTVFDVGFVRDLPLNGREFLQLGLLGPGSAPPAAGSELSTQSASGLHFNGAREVANNFLLDGVDNNDWFINRIVVNPSVEFIQEFKVLSGSYAAEFGRNGGGQVLVVTRSGTNRVRGTAYEFLRNAALDARNLFDPPEEPIPQFQRNQFGFFLGGPLRADRSFAAVGYEGTRSRQAITRTALVPTVPERRGDFSQSTRVVLDPVTRQPFSGNIIPSARIDAIGSAIARIYPDPNRSDPQANLVASPVGRTDLDQTYIRWDHSLSPRDTVYTRYSYLREDALEPFNEGVTNLPGFGSVIVGRAQNAVISYTRSFSPLWVLDARLGFNRFHREVLQENITGDLAAGLGIPGLSKDPIDAGMPAVIVTGYDRLADNTALPIVRRDNTYQAAASLSWSRGRHHFKTGADLRRFQNNGFNHVFARGQFSFQGFYTGHALADLLMGLPSLTIQAVNDNPQAMRAGSLNFFVQDDWKALPNLSIQAGMRYEYNPPPVDKHDRMAIFDTRTLRLVHVGHDGISRSGLAKDLNNFAPRIGISWSPSKLRNTTLRAAYGIFYDSNTLITNSGLYFNPPYFDLALFFPPPNQLPRLSDPFPTGGAFRPRSTVNSVTEDFRNAYVQQWNAGIERQIGEHNLARIGYIASKGTKLIRRHNINQPPPGIGNINARRPISTAADVTLTEPSANSSYHSLQASLERRFSRGIHFLGAYTYSRSIDDASDFLATNGDDNYPQDNSRLYLERGLSNFDLRHRISITGMFEMPYGPGRRWGSTSSGFRKAVLGDWQAGTIVSLQSGFPFTPRLSRDNSNTGNVGGVFGSDRPHRVAAGDLDHRSADRFFDTSAFTIPQPFTFGNSGRNVLTGPRLANVDFSLHKRFIIRAERALEFRAELFNLFNTPPLGLPERVADQPATFGKILSAGPSRQIQFALKLLF